MLERMLRAGAASFVGALVLACCASCGSFSSSAPDGTSDASTDAGADAPSEASPGATEITRVGVSTSAFSSTTSASVTLANLPTAQPGDLLYAVLVWSTPSTAPIAAPAGWTLRGSIDDGFEGRGASFFRVVRAGDAATEHVFPLPTAARAGGLLVTYRGVFAAPQHVVVERAQSFSTNEGTQTVPSLDAAERGHMLLVVASTYGDPMVPITIAPALTPVANVGRLAAFDAPRSAGATGDYAVRDSFVALRATLTFLTVFRPAR